MYMYIHTNTYRYVCMMEDSTGFSSLRSCHYQCLFTGLESKIYVRKGFCWSQRISLPTMVPTLFFPYSTVTLQNTVFHSFTNFFTTSVQFFRIFTFCQVTYFVLKHSETTIFIPSSCPRRNMILWLVVYYLYSYG